MSKVLVAMREVDYRRDGTVILQDVSWTVHEGEHWALLGANGSGKTTLLKIITGYEWPTKGHVDVLGHRYGEYPLAEVRRHLGWVSRSLEQRIPGRDEAVDVVLSGLEATLGLYRTYTDTERADAERALDMLGAAYLGHRTYGCLSQGEQQRVAIARALVARPRLLILDEPCSGLDPAAREALLADLERLARSEDAPSLVMVTHHIEELGPSIGHVCVLREGRVLAQGTKADTLTADLLSEAFGCTVNVGREDERYTLKVAPRW